MIVSCIVCKCTYIYILYKYNIYIYMVVDYDGIHPQFARTSSVAYPLNHSLISSNVASARSPLHLHELGIAHDSTEHTGIKASWHSHATRHSWKAAHTTHTWLHKVKAWNRKRKMLRSTWKASREASWEATITVASCYKQNKNTVSCQIRKLFKETNESGNKK